MSGETFAEQVRREAIQNGFSPDLAGLISRNVAKGDEARPGRRAAGAGMLWKASMSGETFAERVRREAIEAGFSPELADLIGREVAHGDEPAAVLSLCAVYDARGLALDLIRSRLPARAVGAMLAQVAGSNGTISAGGAERVRMILLTGGFR